MIDTPEILKTAVQEGAEVRARLKLLLESLPPTRCQRKTDCCSLLPQMSLVEASLIQEFMNTLPDDKQFALIKKLVEYFFLNATRIMGCPFLGDHACGIYEFRPFGCRAYGMWSESAYNKMSGMAVEAQNRVRQAWAGMGIDLPEEVTGYRPAYCRDVEFENGPGPGDDLLNDIEKKIHEENARLQPWSVEFGHKYGADLSFLYSASLLGYNSALRNKVNIVEDLLDRGESRTLNTIRKKYFHSNRPSV